MIRVRFIYSDGKEVIKEFPTEKEMRWFAYNEGDHLVDIIYIRKGELND